jgi:site-specific DNA-methyltransferase (adenine-specific)
MKLLFGDCLDLMRYIPDASVDLILCDLPYGTTACKWDVLLPFESLWKQYSRIAKGPVVLTSAQPFTSLLITSNLSQFRHEWIWDKVRPSGMLNAKRQPMMRHESVCVFSKQSTNYKPIMEARAGESTEALSFYDDAEQVAFQEDINEMDAKLASVSGVAVSASDDYHLKELDGVKRTYTEKYPQSIIKFCKPTRALHATQKPVKLMEYFIKTYSPQNGMVMDNCMGSGTTGVACINTDRDFIGMENNREIYNTALTRIGEELQPYSKNQENELQPELFS